MLQSMGYQLAATPGTAEYFQQHGITNILVLTKPDNEFDQGDNTVLKLIKDQSIDLVINIAEGTTRSDEVTAGYRMRRAAVDYGASLLTNIK